MMKNLFPGRPAIGSTLLLNGVGFEIIGVLASVGRDENNSTNFRVYVPYNTMRLFFPIQNATTTDPISFMNIPPFNRDQHSVAIETAHPILPRNDAFSYNNM